MNQQDQLLDQTEDVGKNNEEKEKEDKDSSDDEPTPKKVFVTVQELPEITVSEIACLNISLEEIEDFAKSSETAAALFASLSDDIMTGLSDQTEMLSYEVLTTILYQIVRCYNIRHPDNRVALFDFNLAKSDKDDIEGRIYFNEGGNCRRFILPVHTERRVEGLKSEDEHFALIYMDKADNGHMLYADSARLFKFPDDRIKNIGRILGMPNAAVEKLDPERVQVQTLTNSCGVHVAANCFAFLEYGIQFPRIRVDATNIRQQIVKFVRGSNYVKERFSIELGVQINWMEPKTIKIPEEFEEIVEIQQAPKSSARRARNPVPASAQHSVICDQSAENSDASKTLKAKGLPAIRRASERIRQKRMRVNPPAPENGIGGSVDLALLVSNARVLGQKLMDECLGGPAPESGIGDVGDLEWLLRNGRLAQFFIAQCLGRPAASGPGALDIQPISQGAVVDAAKVPANEEGETFSSDLNSKTNDLETASDSIGQAQIVQEEMLEYQVSTPVDPVTSSGTPSLAHTNGNATQFPNKHNHPISQKEVVDSSKVSASEEGKKSSSNSKSRTNDLATASESIADAQSVQEEMLEDQEGTPVDPVIPSGIPSLESVEVSPSHNTPIEAEETVATQTFVTKSTQNTQIKKEGEVSVRRARADELKRSLLAPSRTRSPPPDTTVGNYLRDLVSFLRKLNRRNEKLCEFIDVMEDVVNDSNKRKEKMSYYEILGSMKRLFNSFKNNDVIFEINTEDITCCYDKAYFELKTFLGLFKRFVSNYDTLLDEFGQLQMDIDDEIRRCEEEENGGEQKMLKIEEIIDRVTADFDQFGMMKEYKAEIEKRTTSE